MGVNGEQAWKAAAQVRTLLRLDPQPTATILHAAEFWQDPDVRWLIGVHGDPVGVEYFDKEPFETLRLLAATPLFAR